LPVRLPGFGVRYRTQPWVISSSSPARKGKLSTPVVVDNDWVGVVGRSAQCRSLSFRRLMEIGAQRECGRAGWLRTKCRRVPPGTAKAAPAVGKRQAGRRFSQGDAQLSCPGNCCRLWTLCDYTLQALVRLACPAVQTVLDAGTLRSPQPVRFRRNPRQLQRHGPVTPLDAPLGEGPGIKRRTFAWVQIGA
jgi:hypothetical protein